MLDMELIVCSQNFNISHRFEEKEEIKNETDILERKWA